MSKTHRLFISHSWKYSDQYETITGWFDEASYFNWINYSIPITNPVDFDSKKELKQKITNKINQVNCVVILAGMYAAHSEWIDYEIDWVFVDENKSAIYWVGSYDAPTTDVNQYKWTSNNNHEQTETSILASTDDTKEFSYNNGIISFTASMQGVSKTFELKKQ